MTDHTSEMISSPAILREMVGTEINLLQYLIFGGVCPDHYDVIVYAKIDILDIIAKKDLKNFLKLPLFMIDFKSDCQNFMDIDQVSSARKIANFADLDKFYVILEGRCLLISSDKTISILSDFNEYQLILIDRKLSDSVMKSGFSTEPLDSEIMELGKNHAAFFEKMMTRVRAWNDANVGVDRSNPN